LNIDCYFISANSSVELTNIKHSVLNTQHSRGESDPVAVVCGV